MNEIKRTLPWLLVGGAVLVLFWSLFFRRSSREIVPTFGNDSYELVTVLSRDAIPAIFDPQFYTVNEADGEYRDDELVLGVAINGEARAYSTSHLNRHEIVNDVVGGHPIAITW